MALTLQHILSSIDLDGESSNGWADPLAIFRSHSHSQTNECVLLRIPYLSVSTGCGGSYPEIRSQSSSITLLTPVLVYVFGNGKNAGFALKLNFTGRVCRQLNLPGFC